MPFGSLSSQQRVMVLLELLGGPKFAAEMKGAATSAGLLGRNVERSGKQIAVASRRTFLANQALYTMRRYSFYATTAVIGLTAVVAKLGYSYLSAMQNARVALGPVIKDHAVLESYLTRLFKISKYSPFVLKDLAIGFRQLFAGLNPIGISAPTILTTIQSLTDFMSYTGKTGPGQFQRVALAIQHMAFAGRLTGYLVNQLSRDGIPIFAILNKEMGITGDQLHNISKMGIPASKVLDAINKYARESPAVSGAAMRLSLHSFSGLMQVARDSISQLAGAFIGSSYKGTQGWLFNLLKQGGPLDRLSNMGTAHGGTAAVLLLSKQLTGNKGLGRGFLLMLSILQNIGRLFVRVIIPAWIMGAHALIVFYPILKLVNWGLGFMAKHGTILKYVLAILAAEFIVTHSAILGTWAAMRLFNIATLGAIGPLKRFIVFLGYAVLGPKSMASLNVLLGSLSGSMRALALSTWAAAAPFVAWAAAIAAIIYGLRKLDEHMNTQRKMTEFVGGKWNPVTWLAYPGQKILGRHASGGFTGGGMSLVGEHGPELAHFPRGTQITPNKSVNSMLPSSTVGGLGNERPIVVQLVVDRQILAEQVARAGADKQARR